MDNRTAKRGQENLRNVIGNGDIDLAAEHNRVTVAVGRLDDRTEVDRRHRAVARLKRRILIGSAGRRRDMVELVVQLECEVAAVTVDRQREDRPILKRVVAAVAVVGIGDQIAAEVGIAEGDALRLQPNGRHVDQRGCRETVSATGCRAIGTKVDGGRQRTAGRRTAAQYDGIGARTVAGAVVRGRTLR